MKRYILFFITALCVIGIAQAEEVSPVDVVHLTCEHLTNPMGIGNTQPRLSWKLRSDRQGETQVAYEIRAASSLAGLKTGADNLWDSGKIVSDQSVLVPWGGKALGSRSQVFWQVRVWVLDGPPTTWSNIASFELGLLDTSSEWKGKWITADLPRYDVEQSTLAKASWINAGSTATQAAAIRLAVNLPDGSTVRSAVVDAAADGLTSIYVNGHPNKQGPTSLTAPLHATVLDQLVPGKNVIAIGSAAVRNAIRKDRGATGRNAIAASVKIEFTDGRTMEFDTDDSWKATIPTDTHWANKDFDDSSWAAATVIAPYSAQPSKYWGHTIGPGRYVRTHFAVTKPVAKARLYATALGVYEASINGQRVSDDLFAPGWTDYTKRVMVQTYDVTGLIHLGQNAVGAVLGDGWYAGRLGWMGLAQYGKRPVFNAQLEIAYTDGSSDVIATDDSWKAGPGEIVGSDEQWGEVQDARNVVKDWDSPNFDDGIWTNAVTEEHSIKLVPQVGPPVRELKVLIPQRITKHGDAWIVDFGQNLVGHVRLLAQGKPGSVITVRHAETTNSDGLLYTENLRTALATDKYTLAEDKEAREPHFTIDGVRYSEIDGHPGKLKAGDILEPHFTFHGFRYAEIDGYSGKLEVDDIRAIAVGSVNAETGTFESSDDDLNRLYQNIVWSQRGNFLSVPTDCPQRDERLGWMGDAQVFAPTAAWNADVAAFFTKWLVDVDDGQSTNGDFADVSPRVSRPQPAMPVWGDAGVIIPWVMYETYGDIAFLKDNYPYMARWVDFSERRSHNLILNGGVGDHLAPVRTPTEVVDTAYFANSAHLVARAAEILGKTDDATHYNKLFRDITKAFNENFVAVNGMIQGDTQTGYILALRFGLLPEALRTVAAKRLADDVAAHGHVTGGFVGNGLICPTLTQIGRPDLAWDLVLTKTYPSWLFSVKNGATTIWERWDGWTPERGFQDSSMNSFNHYSLGSVGAWLYSGAAGIQPDEASPGYKHFFLAPRFTPRLAHVKATFDSPYGVISSEWRAEKGGMEYDVTVPPNSSATLVLPGDKNNGVLLKAGTYQFEVRH